MEYFLDNDQASFLSSAMLAGSIVAGPLAAYALSHIGRKFTISFAATVGLLIGAAIFFSNSYYTILASIAVIGMYDTCVISCLMLYLVETMTGVNKGKIIVSIYSFFSIGRLFGTILARFTLTPYIFDHWKVPIFVNCCILLLAYYPILFFLRESVKYSADCKDKIQAIEDFNGIQRFNHSQEHLIANNMLLSQADFQRLSSLAAIQTDSNEDHTVHRSTAYYFVQTFLFTFSIICTLYTFIIHTMIVPYIMGTDQSSLTSNIIIMSGELLGVVLMMTFIENRFVGRKRIVVDSHVLMAISFGIYYFMPTLNITIVMYVAKIFLKTALSTSFIHLNESFPIRMRAKVVMFVTTTVNKPFSHFTHFFNRLFS